MYPEFTNDYFDWAFQSNSIEREDDFPVSNESRDREEWPNERFTDDDPFGMVWPKIPNGGEPKGVITGYEPDCSCEKDRHVMGYYIPWHFTMERVFRRTGEINPFLIEEEDSNRKECKKWGIHLCMTNIQRWIDQDLMPLVSASLSPVEQIYYRDYAEYLMVMKVLAHEWGHYQTEVLEIQQINSLSQIMDPRDVHYFGGNYLKYFISTAGRRDDFEEVFAEWCALRFGVFNANLIRPDNLPKLPNSKELILKRDWLIRKGLLGSMQSANAPYGHIKDWVDFEELSSLDRVNQYIGGVNSMSYAVGRATRNSLKYSGNLKMIDIVMHNINCYSRNNFSKHYPIPAVRSTSGHVGMPISSLRPGLGLNQNPQSPNMDKSNYMEPTRRGIVKLTKPLKLNGFRYDIERLPLKSYDELPVKVYIH